MLDAQMHYPVFTHDYRAVPQHSAPVAKRGVRRIFRLGESRPTRYHARSR